jgi:tripartite-type tricarboxylate transporter receptor subunit TctC
MGMSHLGDTLSVMDLPRRRFLRLGAMAALAALSGRADAQSAPPRGVHLVAGFAADDSAESLVGILAQRLSEIWGQEVSVQSKQSVDAPIAFDEVAHAEPDGHTLLLAVGAPEVSRLLFPSLTVDPAAAFAPLSMIGTFPFIIAVSNSSQIDSIESLVGYAKSHPGLLSWASPGRGTPPHLAGELFELLAGIKMTHVPYDGLTEYLIDDLVSGRVTVMFDTAGALLQPLASHQVRGLAVTSATRLPILPELHTVAESGVPGYDISSWYGLYAPAKTPPDIVQKINGDVVVMLRETTMKAQLEPLGIVVASSRPEELAAKNSAAAAMWKPLIETAKITVQ